MRRFVMALGLGVALLTACGDPYQCSAPTVTTRTCGSIQACCTSSQCEYRSSTGRTWSCDGTNCEAAARLAISQCN
jgi:hypothetical protein